MTSVICIPADHNDYMIGIFGDRAAFGGVEEQFCLL